MSGHTPGPWTIEERAGILLVVAGPRPIARPILWLRQDEESGVYIANARLIASAPDLLEACEGLIAALQLGQALHGADGTLSLPLQRTLEATAKARGITP